MPTACDFQMKDAEIEIEFDRNRICSARGSGHRFGARACRPAIAGRLCDGQRHAARRIRRVEAINQHIIGQFYLYRISIGSPTRPRDICGRRCCAEACNNRSCRDAGSQSADLWRGGGCRTGRYFCCGCRQQFTRNQQCACRVDWQRTNVRRHPPAFSTTSSSPPPLPPDAP